MVAGGDRHARQEHEGNRRHHKAEGGGVVHKVNGEGDCQKEVIPGDKKEGRPRNFFHITPSMNLCVEHQCNGIDAIAQPLWGWAIVEHMAEARVAFAAKDLIPFYWKGMIL